MESTKVTSILDQAPLITWIIHKRKIYVLTLLEVSKSEIQKKKERKTYTLMLP